MAFKTQQATFLGAGQEGFLLGLVGRNSSVGLARNDAEANVHSASDALVGDDMVGV